MNGTLNKVMLIGHTGDDVKVHYFEGGNSIGRFPLATNETYVNRNGERVTNTEWHNIVVRNKAAEICAKYLKKGDRVYIEGRIQTRKWQDDKGIDRYSTEIMCTNFTFLTPKDSSSSTQQNQGYPDSSSNISSNTGLQQSPAENRINLEPDDDLPF